MPIYREGLPQNEGGLFLTDGGLETDLIFNEGFELPLFAAIDLLRLPEGEAAVEAYFDSYLRIAEAHDVGFILESATWRASSDWASALGYGKGLMDDLNERAIALLARKRDESGASGPLVISGCVGPRGDGYDASVRMGADEAADYHSRQIGIFAGTDADQVTAITMKATAIGIRLSVLLPAVARSMKVRMI